MPSFDEFLPSEPRSTWRIAGCATLLMAPTGSYRSFTETS